jgi:hypothetical protein
MLGNVTLYKYPSMNHKFDILKCVLRALWASISFHSARYMYSAQNDV